MREFGRYAYNNQGYQGFGGRSLLKNLAYSNC